MTMKQIIVFLLMAVFVISCQQEPEETNTKGKAHILIPESIAPVLIAQVEKFMSLYKEHGADITYSITISEEAVSKFLEDTLRICFTTIPLNDVEFNNARSISPEMTVTLFAYDAVMFVVNESNGVQSLTTGDIKNILSGSIQGWEKLPNVKEKGKLTVAIKDSTDLIPYFLRRLSLNEIKTSNIIRTQSHSEALKYAKEQRNVLAIIPQSYWNEATGLKVLEIVPSEGSSDTLYTISENAIGKSFIPHAAYIHLRYYPFYRPLFIYCRKPYGNVAAGFLAYVTHTEGQRLILEKGLLPGTQKIRLRSPQE